MKIFTVVGARPNFVKIDPDLKQTIVHTGQHFDYKMSQSFFDELGIPDPTYNLNCKSSDIGKMTDKLSKLFRKHKPTMVLVFGDTNSSMAGALAAAYQQIPVAHIEAGLRSGNKNMPEEINRILIDRIARVRFCPSTFAERNLIAEGLLQDNYVVGDPMFDAMLRFVPIPKSRDWHTYNLLTVHRNINVDTKEYLQNILEAVQESGEKFVLPLHPRTKLRMEEFGLKMPKNIKVKEPVTYRQMLNLVSNAKKVVTDSGGVQREAAWMNVPVILLRTETEWVDIVAKRQGVLVGTNKERILEAIKTFDGLVSGPPQAGTNKKIKEILFKYV